MLVDTELPSLLWYLDRLPERLPISRFDPDQARRQGVYFLFDRRDWERVPSETQAFFEIRGSRGKYLAVVGRPG